MSSITKKIPELKTEPIRIGFHIIGEMITALDQSSVSPGPGDTHTILQSIRLHLIPGILGIIPHCLLNSIDFFIGFVFIFNQI